MKNSVFLFVIVAMIISCNSKRNETTVQTQSSDKDTEIVEDSDSLTQVSVYEGLLPCGDCEGIQTTLKIYQGDGTIESHVFELKSIYKGKKAGNEFVDDGNFNIERGLENDQNGTIYVLNYDQPESERIYYGYNSDNPDKIYLLNNKREKIKSELNYALTLKK
jgi:copper homeostasis protein (lipoprotein)